MNPLLAYIVPVGAIGAIWGADLAQIDLMVKIGCTLAIAISTIIYHHKKKK